MSSKMIAAHSAAYRHVWRWHFYAGLFVLPVLMLMAATGGLYLFKSEIEDLAYGRFSHVEARTTQTSPDRWLRAAEVAAQGRATSVLVPDRPDRAVQVKVRLDQGDRTVFVDPHDAQVTGAIHGEGLMGTVKALHSLSLFGRPFNLLVEIVAGWTIILVATGLYLWWPRGRGRALLVPRRGPATRRSFWRDLHAVTGLYTGAIIAFLALTGMPWSAVWGDQFLNLVRESGLGRPPPPTASGAWSHGGHDAPQGAGWTLEHAVLPADGHGAPSLSVVITSADRQGLARPYTVSIPRDPARAYTAAHVARRTETARNLYVDGHTGEVKADIRWSQFGIGAKGFEWGIAVHEGRQYGQINRWVMLTGCIGVWLLAISGLVMWWKRRPDGPGLKGLRAPPDPGPRARSAVLGLVLPLAVLFPLTGLSLLAAWGVDRLWAVLRLRMRA